MINLIESDVGRSLMHITSNIRDIDLIDSVRKVIDSDRPIEREIQIDGNRFYFMRISPYIRRDKTVDGIVINFTDITESKKLTSIIESIFVSSASAITAQKAIRNDEGKIVDFEFLAANEAAKTFFRAGHTTLEGRRLLRVFAEGERFMGVYEAVTNSGQSDEFEYFQETADKWFNVSVVKMMDGVVATYTDITDKKKTADTIARNYEDLKFAADRITDSNRQLERSNLDLMQFASVASHDLKEPLRKIQAFGNILQSKIKDRLDRDEMNYFDRMINASGRMQILIEDVLSLSKLSDNSLAREKVDLAEVTQSILDDLEIVVREKRAVVEIDPLPAVRAIQWQIRQLFQNLISNALKFSDTKKPYPRIVVHEKKLDERWLKEMNISAGDFVCICVKDNGIGFEKDYNEKIFKIFQRLHGRGYDGTGIGLAIAK
jgi:two-component system, chemotaxis family, CheB/CheR fusion protein